MSDQRDPSRIDRLRDRGREDYLRQRREIDDWIGGSGATWLLALGIAVVVFGVLSIFHIG